MKKLLTMILSFVLLVGTTMPVSAASNTFTVKETGEFYVSMDKGDTTGKMKFKAPAAGTYEISMYGLCYDGEYDVSDEDPYYTSTSSKYDRTLKIKATKGKKTLINTRLANFHKRLVLIKKGGGNRYKDLLEIAQQYTDLQDNEVAKWTKGYNQRDEFSVKLKKGEVVTLTFTGDKKASTAYISIYKK